MLVAVPFPAWAMRPAEVSIPTPEDVTLDSNGEPEIIL
jgi:hypothetical protein